MKTATIKNYDKKFREKHSDEADWLYEHRREAWDSYVKSPLPDRVTHLWRYSKPENFLLPEAEMSLSGPAAERPEEKRNRIPLPDHYTAISRYDGDMNIRTAVNPALESKGIILRDLREAVAKGIPEVKGALGGLIGYGFGKFEALNSALWNRGIFLYIPNNTVLEKPVYLNRYQWESVSVSRLLIIIGANSEATIIDANSGNPHSSKLANNGVIETFVGDCSHLRYVHVQDFPDNSASYFTQRNQVGRDATSYSVFASLGSGISKYDVGTILNGKGAESRLFGLAFGNGKQNFDMHTVHHHKFGDTYSNLDHKVVLKDKANSAYTGLIRIEKDAENCEAYQENRNLLLNKGPKAESIPELEILTDQVRCSHGATMGPIDPEMIFYLKSRGVEYEQAVRMIVYGFMEPTFKLMPETLRDTVRQAVSRKLEG
ncbi:MAG: Fe-S cluster assembly protein SufD [candidate division Zixibacteria bacterium]|nr:Fe-S cluster assembly protein SufD [candidate division Zixibacteria bacterium]